MARRCGVDGRRPSLRRPRAARRRRRAGRGRRAATRVRPGDAAAEAGHGARAAGAGPRGGHDRRRGQRHARAEGRRHRRGHGLRQRGGAGRGPVRAARQRLRRVPRRGGRGPAGHRQRRAGGQPVPHQDLLCPAPGPGGRRERLALPVHPPALHVASAASPSASPPSSWPWPPTPARPRRTSSSGCCASPCPAGVVAGVATITGYLVARHQPGWAWPSSAPSPSSCCSSWPGGCCASWPAPSTAGGSAPGGGHGAALVAVLAIPPFRHYFDLPSARADGAWWPRPSPSARLACRRPRGRLADRVGSAGHSSGMMPLAASPQKATAVGLEVRARAAGGGRRRR